MEIGVDMEWDSYDGVIFDSICLAPRTHNPRIVERNGSHDINALCL